MERMRILAILMTFLTKEKARFQRSVILLMGRIKGDEERLKERILMTRDFFDGDLGHDEGKLKEE